MDACKEQIIKELKQNLLEWEGFRASVFQEQVVVGLKAIEGAFPNAVFPVNGIHEFITASEEQRAASTAFIAGILRQLMKGNGPCLWISGAKDIFPAALKLYGAPPDRFIFIRAVHEKDVLWIAEEGLKAQGVSAVIAELSNITFQQSRRLQLCVEKSNATGFILRGNAAKITPTPCVARWDITALPSSVPAGMPGVGFPCWSVELQKVRNGNPGKWRVQWLNGSFHVSEKLPEIPLMVRRVG